MDNPKISDRVREIGSTTTWRVINVETDRVGLSGPGPCRGIRLVARDEFDDDWERA